MRALLVLILALVIRLTFLLSLISVAAQAAYTSLQTYKLPITPQIFYNIITDAGASCNGDVVTATRTASITSGTKNLSVTANLFSSGDVGKVITIPGAGSGGGNYSGAIATFTDAQHVVLNNNAQTTLSGVSIAITYGTDDRPAFDTFNNWARANQGTSNQVVLTIPNGKSCWFGSGSFNYISIFNAWAAGINNLIVEGTGATINGVGGFGFQLGGLGVCQSGLASAGGCSARIQSVSAASSTVTLTAASLSAGYVSRFSTGQWLTIGGLNVQALWDSPFGYPPNTYYFEWRQITNVNAGTGVITLDRPLTNSYLSTWPEQNAGSNFEADAGGPATIWVTGGSNNTWNTTVEYRGLTISQDGQTYAQGRNVTYRGVTFTGGFGAIPTQNESWSAINTTFATINMETDKWVGTMLLDGVTISQIVNQSTATDLLIMRNSTVTLRLDGGAKRTEITDSTLNLFGPGIHTYGNTPGATICTRCNIGTLNFNEGYIDNPNPSYHFKSGGVIAMPNVSADNAAQRWMIPGTKVFYYATGFGPIGVTSLTGPLTQDPWPSITDNQTVTTNVTMDCSATPKQLDVSTSIFASGDVNKVIYINGVGSGAGTLQTWITAFTSATRISVFDACSTSKTASSQTVQWGTSNTYIQTGEAGGFPNISALTSDPIGAIGGRSWNFTCDSCTGDENAVGASIQAGAPSGVPLGNYLRRTFTPTSAQGDLATMPTRGKIAKLTIDVTAAYAGAAATVALNPTGQFHQFTIKQSNWTQFDWVPTINLKQPGTRVYTPAAGWTCNAVAGGCSGDTVTGAGLPPEAVWITNSISPFMGNSYSGGTAPTFTITIETDQSP